MPSAATHAHGTTLEIFDGVFRPLIEMSVFAMSWAGDEIDTTNHDSLDAWREYILGLKNVEMLCEGNLIIASDSHGFTSSHGVGTLFDTGQIMPWRMIFKNAAQPITFTAFVREYTWEMDSEDKISCSLMLRVTGSIALLELVISLWQENFNYTMGGVGKQYDETWDFHSGNFTVGYTETWDYSNFQTATLNYTEPWDSLGYIVGPSQYLETWESP